MISGCAKRAIVEARRSVAEWPDKSIADLRQVALVDLLGKAVMSDACTSSSGQYQSRRQGLEIASKWRPLACPELPAGMFDPGGFGGVGCAFLPLRRPA